MSKITISIDEMKLKTREMLGLSKEYNLSFINEEFKNAEAIDFNSIEEINIIPNPNYGHYLAYGHREGIGPTYEFLGALDGYAGSAAAVWCHGGATRCYLPMNQWYHRNTDSTCVVGPGNEVERQVAEFTRRR